MVKRGMKAYEAKERRAVRRRNHVAYDLRSPKYHQRVVPSKKKGKRAVEPEFDWEDDEDYEAFCDAQAEADRMNNYYYTEEADYGFDLGEYVD